MDATIQRNTPVDQLPLFLNTEEAAIILDCSTALVRQLCSSGQLPCKKIGRSFKIFRGDLVNYFTATQSSVNTTFRNAKIA